MEDWLAALKAASLREYYEPGLTDTQDFLSNHHHWYDTTRLISNLTFLIEHIFSNRKNSHELTNILLNYYSSGTYIFTIDPHFAMFAEI